MKGHRHLRRGCRRARGGRQDKDENCRVDDARLEKAAKKQPVFTGKISDQHTKKQTLVLLFVCLTCCRFSNANTHSLDTAGR